MGHEYGNYDFGKVFDSYDKNPKNNVLDADEVAKLEKAGYKAKVGMNKSIFVETNKNDPGSIEAYKKEEEVLTGLLDGMDKLSPEIAKKVGEILEKQSGFGLINQLKNLELFDRGLIKQIIDIADKTKEVPSNEDK